MAAPADSMTMPTSADTPPNAPATVGSVAQIADLADHLPPMIAYWDKTLHNVFANAVQAVIGNISALTRKAPAGSARAAAQLPWTVSELVAIFDHIPAVVGFWDNDLRCRFLNKYGGDWFGETRTALRGSHVRELLGAEMFDKNLPYIQAVLAGHPQSFERVFPGRDGRGRDPDRILQLHYLPNDDVHGHVDGFFILGIDISYRVEAGAALQRSTSQLAILDERQRIAADLHDVVIQRLYAAGLDVQALQREPGGDGNTRLAAIAEAVDDAILELRASIHNLKAGIEAAELSAAIDRLLRQATRTLGFAPTVTVTGSLVDPSPTVGAELLAVLSEALANVSRHAGATRVDITVTVADGTLTAQVADDGIGTGSLVFKSGIANMRDRATALAGTFEVRAGDPSGTVLVWQVPVAEPAGRGMEPTALR